MTVLRAAVAWHPTGTKIAGRCGGPRRGFALSGADVAHQQRFELPSVTKLIHSGAM